MEEKKRKEKNKRLFNTYGITIEHWEEMFKKQGEVCWMCQGMPKNNILCVDHLHIKGFKKLLPEQRARTVRGLLCFQCNTSFGRIERRKNPRKLLERINAYFNQFPIKGDNI